MKKNIYKLLAGTFAMALVVASPMASMTTHALGFNANSPEDTTDRGTRPSNSDNSGSTSGSSTSSSSGSTGSTGSSSSGGSSDNGNSSSSGNGNSSSDNSATVNNPNDVTVGVAGGQKFRIVMNDEHTSYQVYHCGISKITFNVTDAEDNIIAYKNITLEQDANGMWYANIQVDENLDAEKLAVNVLKGDETYLGTELDVMGIKVNGEVRLLTRQTSGFNIDAPVDSTERGTRPSNN
ncbi:MAG: hypothetical protein HDQ97_17665 [Lachnospiraceae bacterium]|nr:hypothetical protein [Lachnospiraceae bacterium]